MRLVIINLLFSASLFASIGDNAPSVPSTYVQTHPRLPYPDNTFLAKICNNGGSGGTTSVNDGCSMSTQVSGSRQGWNSASPGGHITGRYLLVAYLATKNNGTPNATYLTKLQSLCSTNINSFSSNWDAALTLSFLYDWIYADLGSGNQATLRTSLYSLMTAFESGVTSNALVPYSDVFYLGISADIIDIMPAVAVYPDDPSNSLPHLRFAMDLWFNMMVPAWKQIIGGTYCGTSTDASNDCGGSWMEGWNGYVNEPLGLAQWYTAGLLSWATASGRGISTVFTSDFPGSRISPISTCIKSDRTGPRSHCSRTVVSISIRKAKAT